MKTQAELDKIDVDIDYRDNEKIVRGFLTLSALNRMAEFDFEEAFDHLKQPLWNKLIEHAQGCTFNEFNEYMNMCWWGDVDLSVFTAHSDYFQITEQDVFKAMSQLHYDKLKETFHGAFEDVEELHTLSSSATNHASERQANVILFDRVIHAQHVTGDIFDDLDIDDIKSDLDEELIEMMGINVCV